MAGPLRGRRVVEVAGQGPVPFAGMMLADMGAEVIRVERMPGGRAGWPDRHRTDTLSRGRRSVQVDLKNPLGADVVLRLVAGADALIEGFRPGVAERLGIGPAECLARNPALVYGRMTGWGQHGPEARRAGHDLNYLALTGALYSIGQAGGPPVPPLNLVADFGGGGMLLAFGVVCALLEAGRSGQGQVIDAAMVDGVAALMAPFYAMAAAGRWSERRGTNILDSGAHFYGVYETADGRHVAVAAIEPKFYQALIATLGLDAGDLPPQMDAARWPEMKRRLAAVFRTRTLKEWCAAFEEVDACFAPVLTPVEAVEHPHAVARQAFTRVDGIPQPAPAPRFARTPAGMPEPPPRPGEHTGEVLAAAGFTDSDIDALRAQGVVA
ncbi:alpha-methylacyl-CoA racemase [Thermocatellispora tengchongensis]|uniref:Alpha-methylacyl-CoA racemase n=1 Tax=Thermocatellispora tengchongensis TaxID=1073253 RepID=A0A840PLK4_9ACTN|nr:CaiB/BaiF CoA-transferase family protein [Thermocatellispora tengchongensis]MBB5139796.1 alpha-methylacyl-CoA racemase [Thermocatellispora tengchongensis]